MAVFFKQQHWSTDLPQISQTTDQYKITIQVFWHLFHLTSHTRFCTSHLTTENYLQRLMILNYIPPFPLPENSFHTYQFVLSLTYQPLPSLLMRWEAVWLFLSTMKWWQTAVLSHKLNFTLLWLTLHFYSLTAPPAPHLPNTRPPSAPHSLRHPPSVHRAQVWSPSGSWSSLQSTTAPRPCWSLWGSLLSWMAGHQGPVKWDTAYYWVK